MEEKVLFKVTEEPEGINSEMSCENLMQLSEVCLAIVHAILRDDSFAHMFSVILERGMTDKDFVEKMFSSAVKIPDFNEVLKKAKIDKKN